MHALHGRSAAAGDRAEADAARPQGHRRDGRRRRLRAGHGSLHPHDPPQPRPHDHHPQQPGLRADDRARPPPPPTTSCAPCRPRTACSSSRSTRSASHSPRRPPSSRAGSPATIAHLTDLYKQAFAHKGFALVDVFQPCVTWNKLNTAAWFKERVYKLEETGLGPHEPLGGLRAVDDELPRPDVHARGVPRADRRLLPRRRTCRPTRTD